MGGRADPEIFAVAAGSAAMPGAGILYRPNLSISTPVTFRAFLMS